MAQLRLLAQQFQRALDSNRGSIRSDAADAAGCTLYKAMEREFYGSEDTWEALQPIIQQTALATSIVSYVERISWAEVTPQMLFEAGGPSPNTLVTSSKVLTMLIDSVLLVDPDSSNAQQEAALLLRQAHIPRIYDLAAVWSPHVMGTSSIALKTPQTKHPHCTQFHRIGYHHQVCVRCCRFW